MIALLIVAVVQLFLSTKEASKVFNQFRSVVVTLKGRSILAEVLPTQTSASIQMVSDREVDQERSRRRRSASQSGYV